MLTNSRPRRTKIVITLGPASESEEVIGGFLDLDVNIFRINMSHASHDWAKLMTRRVRQLAEAKGKNCAVLFDLSGPSIRTGDLAEPFELKAGDLLEFRKEGTEPTIPLSTTVNYPGMMDDVTENSMLVVDNGTLLMHIQTRKDDRIICEVRNAGILGSRRHINLPGTRLSLPAITPKDEQDLALAVECEADFIAASFVRDASHVQQVRHAVQALEGTAQIISKIENQEAIENLDPIIQASDAIMIARGDLGIEVDFEELPILQRRIVKRCHDFSRRIITATQMLDSMITNPTPTRAEVTDCANAAFEEADALMLSGETSIGEHPVRCVDTMIRIISRIERTGGLGYGQGVFLQEERQKIARAAVMLADSMPNARLVVLTRRGVLANLTAMFRPKSMQFYAFTPRAVVCRQLSLTRAVKAHKMAFCAGIDETVKRAATILVESGEIAKGTPLIVVSDLISDHIAANSIILHHA